MIKVENLTVKAKHNKLLLQNISICLKRGEVLGLTGPSGAGKTTLIKSIMGILDNSYTIIGEKISVDGKKLSNLSLSQRRQVCGTTIGFIPQNPMTAFDDRIKIGKQIKETFRLRLNISNKDALELAMNKLREVNLIDVHRVLESYPFQLSGGMLQRVAIAILLGLKPQYILADEPTSALDEDNRNMLLNILKDLAQDVGILMISHDVFVLNSLCKEVVVLEYGTIIEKGTVEQLISSPKQEWTRKFAAINKKQNGRKWKWTEL